MKHLFRITTSFIMFLFAMSTYAANDNDKCTIYFNDNGGSGGPGSQTITKVPWLGFKSFTLSSTIPTRTAYTFNDWIITGISGGNLLDGLIESKVGSVWKAGSQYSVSGVQSSGDVNVSVYLSARWTPISYTITYNGNGGTPSKSSESYTIETAARTVTATRTGYTFAGWTVSSNAGNWSTSDNISSSIPSGKYGNVTLVAKWTPNSYTISFNGNGSTSGSMSDLAMVYDVAKDLTANAYKREYSVSYDAQGGECSKTSDASVYQFTGWDDKNGHSYTDGHNVINLTSTHGGVVTLYAQWESQAVTLPTPTRTGYTFNGWYTSATGGTKIGDAGGSFTPIENSTLYGHWSLATADLTINETGLAGKDGIIVTVTVSGSAAPVYVVSLDADTPSVTIKSIPVGTYVIAETGWSHAYTVDQASYEKKISGNTEVTFAHTSKSTTPLHAEKSVTNWKSDN